MEKQFIYQTDFFLKAEVLDLDAANEYLHEENMINYLKEDFSHICFIFEKLEWNLINEKYGKITLVTNRELTDNEKKSISKWINGQCSDGLGEGFEQQDFACYTELQEAIYDNKKHCLYSIDMNEEEYDDTYITMCSFDWETNDYELTLVED